MNLSPFASSENAAEVTKPKGRAGSKKAPTQKVADDEIVSLQERLAAYNFGASSDQSAAMETEKPPVPAGKKEYSKRGGAKKKSSSTIVLDTSDSDNENNVVDDDDDEDFELQQQAASEAGKKKGGRKPAAQNAKKPPAAIPRKRNVGNKQSQTLGQKFITDMLQPAESSGISPEKKVRKMRESPFNKKSSSVLGRVADKDETANEDLSGSASTSPSIDEVAEIAPAAAKARPQRANRRHAVYVLSESESDNDSDVNASDFSDFEDED